MELGGSFPEGAWNLTHAEKFIAEMYFIWKILVKMWLFMVGYNSAYTKRYWQLK